ncbi:MAG: asparagine synthase C-terminal domain-containing protein [Lamprobacter sp.]|uniref:asparagine synthase C-terminal domain-containing protein n=1 Tax=Lamprobacter sp. TaxID=3100796 RepID=UPI002B25EEBC|nr:asparagine synthase C-terminal domain-containing protein [Lamprobacter sp.]MEA3639819.1 asparagine synthase C-terminal domain-containing protein [Lamprobacter sp.]
MTPYDLNMLGQEQRPFFFARFLGDHVEVEGVSDCLIGEKISSTDPDRPDGLFVEWHWDGRRLIVHNDFYGFSPLFYASYDNTIRISPSLEEVVKGDVPRDLDNAALAVILRMGHPVGDDTPFQAVRALPPGSTLMWEQGQLQIDSPELPIRRGPYAQISFDEAADQFAHLFDQAIRKRIPRDDNLVFPLSGGRDSRHILFALEANGIKPQSCVTLEYRPPATNEDARIAALVADAMNIEHQVIEKAPSWFQAVLKEAHLSNFCGGSHSWILPLAAYLKGRTNTLYDGLAGSVISGGFMANERKLKLYQENRFEELAHIVLTEGGSEGFNKTFLRSSFYDKASIEIAVERVVKELWRHSEATNPMLSFIFWNRTRRGVSQIPLAIMAHIPSVHCPYLDRDVYDFLTSVEPSYFLSNKLHDEAIHRSYPSYAHLPYEDSSKKADYQKADYLYFKKSVEELWGHLIKHSFKSSKMLRKEYLYPRVMYDLLKRENHMPWYLIKSVFCIELEKV